MGHGKMQLQMLIDYVACFCLSYFWAWYWGIFDLLISFISLPYKSKYSLLRL